MFKLILPFPPSANKSLVYSRKKVYRNPACDRFYQSVMYEKIRNDIPSFAEDKRFFIHIFLYPPDARKSDIDNRVRSIFNAFQASGIVCNDFQFDVLYVKRGQIQKGGSCIVNFGEMNEEKGFEEKV